MIRGQNCGDCKGGEQKWHMELEQLMEIWIRLQTISRIDGERRREAWEAGQRV